LIPSNCFSASGKSTNCVNGVCTDECTGAVAGTHSAYAYIDAYCVPLIIDAPPVCANVASVDICAPPGYLSYSWPSGQPGITGAPTSQCVTINNPTPGITYTVNMTSVTGCPTTTTVTLKGFDFSVQDATVCQGSPPFTLNVTPTVTGNFTYNWSPSTGLSCTTCQNPTFTPSIAGTTTYTVSMTDPTIGSGSGAKTKSLKVVVGQETTVTAIGATGCSGTSATLTADGKSCGSTVTYSWSPNTFLSNTTSASVTAINPTATTTYTVTVTNLSGQTASATALLTVNPNPIVSATPVSIW